MMQPRINRDKLGKILFKNGIYPKLDFGDLDNDHALLEIYRDVMMNTEYLDDFADDGEYHYPVTKEEFYELIDNAINALKDGYTYLTSQKSLDNKDLERLQELKNNKDKYFKFSIEYPAGTEDLLKNLYGEITEKEQ